MTTIHTTAAAPKAGKLDKKFCRKKCSIKYCRPLLRTSFASATVYALRVVPVPGAVLV